MPCSAERASAVGGRSAARSWRRWSGTTPMMSAVSAMPSSMLSAAICDDFCSHDSCTVLEARFSVLEARFSSAVTHKAHLRRAGGARAERTARERSSAARSTCVRLGNGREGARRAVEEAARGGGRHAGRRTSSSAQRSAAASMRTIPEHHPPPATTARGARSAPHSPPTSTHNFTPT